LISLAKQGNDKAFEEIIKRYKEKIGRIIYGMLGNSQDAEDVGQEVFIRFYYSMDRFRGDAEVSTYLTRIAINLSINELRRRKRKKFNFNNYIERQEISNEPSLQKKIEMNELIEKSIDCLNPKLRAVVVLRFLSSYSIKEIAEMLKLPKGTVLSRLSRAQEKLLVKIKPMLEK
jgi:RNA polymerase sigma-70 factor (ECF subfamily)